jgi:hypothetical protein
MKASELIATLQHLVATRGDREVFCFKTDETEGPVSEVEVFGNAPERWQEHRVGDFCIR